MSQAVCLHPRSQQQSLEGTRCTEGVVQGEKLRLHRLGAKPKFLPLMGKACNLNRLSGWYPAEVRNERFSEH